MTQIGDVHSTPPCRRAHRQKGQRDLVLLAPAGSGSCLACGISSEYFLAQIMILPFKYGF